jgi:hypothetical protein
MATQHFPDSPNHAKLPATVFHRGQVFTSSTVYQFSTCWHLDALRLALTTRLTA